MVLFLPCCQGVIDTFDYAPGPMDTQLQQELITSKTLDPTIRKLCADRAAEVWPCVRLVCVALDPWN